jgi:predicted ATPase
MADPAAVLAEALIALLGVMAPTGAVLIMDDLHWADEDTISALIYLADSVVELPLALTAGLENARLSAAQRVHPN